MKGLLWLTLERMDGHYVQCHLGEMWKGAGQGRVWLVKVWKSPRIVGVHAGPPFLG